MPSKSSSPSSKGSSKSPGTPHEDDDSMFMLYYMQNGEHIRPVAVVVGTLSDERAEVLPYIKRRSCGEVQLVQYDPTDIDMKHDYHYVMETGIAPISTESITVVVKKPNVKVAVWGESFCGYIFEGELTMELSSRLHVGYWTEEGFLEEALQAGGEILIEVAEGTANLFVCDNKVVTILYDSECTFYINMVNEPDSRIVVLDEDKLKRIVQTALDEKPAKFASPGGELIEQSVAPTRPPGGPHGDPPKTVAKQPSKSDSKAGKTKAKSAPAKPKTKPATKAKSKPGARVPTAKAKATKLKELKRRSTSVKNVKQAKSKFASGSASGLMRSKSRSRSSVGSKSSSSTRKPKSMGRIRAKPVVHKSAEKSKSANRAKATKVTSKKPVSAPNKPAKTADKAKPATPKQEVLEIRKVSPSTLLDGPSERSGSQSDLSASSSTASIKSNASITRLDEPEPKKDEPEPKKDEPEPKKDEPEPKKDEPEPKKD